MDVRRKLGGGGGLTKPLIIMFDFFVADPYLCGYYSEKSHQGNKATILANIFKIKYIGDAIDTRCNALFLEGYRPSANHIHLWYEPMNYLPVPSTPRSVSRG